MYSVYYVLQELNEVTLEVTIPGAYPEKPIIVRIPEHEIITDEGLDYVNDIFERYTSSNVSGSGGFRSFLCWLDKNILSIFKDVTAERSFVQEASQFQSESECEDSTDSSGADDEDHNDSKEEIHSVQSLPNKRGTEVRLHGLNISQSIATVSFANPMFVVRCTRCKTCEDIRLKADR